MPRFYFNVHDGKSGLDTTGIELSDWQAAHMEAIRFAGEILKDDAAHIILNDDWCLEVTDHRGLTLLRVAVVVTASPILKRRAKDQEDDAR